MAASASTGLPDFSWYRKEKPDFFPNEHKMYPMVITYPKCPENIPSGYKTYRHFPF
jgi:hypothetical protein